MGPHASRSTAPFNILRNTTNILKTYGKTKCQNKARRDK